MDTKSLTLFLRAAELGSFTKAGAELGCSQSTVSFQIRLLEEELGVPLFERINRSILLTDKGREVMIFARRFIQMSAELDCSLNGAGSRPVSIRIAAADSLRSSLLGDGYGTFLEENPRILLKVLSAGKEDMFRMLDRNEADAILTLENQIYNPDYIVVREAPEGIHFVAPAGHCSAPSLEELLREPFILTEKGMSYRALLDEQLARCSAEIQPVLEVGDPHLICGLVRQGAGVSFLPDFVTQQGVEDGSLVRLDVPQIQVSIWKQLLHHRDKWVSPQLQKVLEHCIRKVFTDKT